MSSNWGKAIQMAVTTLGAMVLGTVLAFFFDSFWPIGIVVFGCCATACHSEVKIYLLGRRNAISGVAAFQIMMSISPAYGPQAHPEKQNFDESRPSKGW